MRKLSAILLLVVVVACSAQPLEINVSRDVVHISVMQLGEYVRTIRKLQLQVNSRIIWELVAEGGVVQWGEMKLHVGANPVKYDSIYRGSTGVYKTTVPSEGEYFILKPNVEYTVLVWGQTGGPAQGTFILGVK